MEAETDELDWTVRSFVYATIVERGHPPTVAETAAGLGIGVGEARAAYRRLDRRHALFLDPLPPGADAIRMAHPFSGVPTPFRVRANSRDYWANCAWDALGIPAALHADATIDAVLAEDGAPARLAVEAGRVRGQDEVVHVLRPFRTWYDDLIET